MSVTDSLKDKHTFAKKHIQRKLFRRLWIFVIIFFGLLGFIMYDIAEHHFNPFLIGGAFLVGLGIGCIAGRIFYIYWHRETEKVVSRLDTLGIIILIAYIGLTLTRDRIFGVWFHGPMLTALSFTFATGAILGRILIMTKSIRRVLAEQGIPEAAEL